VDLGSVDHREDRLEEEALFKLLFKIILNPKCFSCGCKLVFVWRQQRQHAKGVMQWFSNQQFNNLNFMQIVVSFGSHKLLNFIQIIVPFGSHKLFSCGLNSFYLCEIVIFFRV
jgi:hypothetical protein